jgi:hypothetical protein
MPSVRGFRHPLLVALTMTAGVASAASANPAQDMLDRLRSLAGDWHGTVQWTGARTDSGVMDVAYYVTGNGSAVVENLLSDGVSSMTSVYHLDGDDLRMTHYCAARNQPRLKAEKIDAEGGTAHFTFVDATNLKAPDAPHVDGFDLEIVDPSHLVLRFAFIARDQRSLETIRLERVAAAPAG